MRGAALALVVLVGCATLYAGWRISRPRPVVVPLPTSGESARTSREVSRGPALPPIRASRFLNTGSDAQYIGRRACAECHPDQHDSYLHTAHSRAMEDIELAQEPPDAMFQHALSGRHYSAFRHGDEFRHREELLGTDGRIVAAVELPMRYAIGSGNHSRSYLAELDGFLVESPITWYAARQGWAMSPGYDHPRHHGFELLADFGCLLCHAGQVAPIDDNRYRVAVHEAAIGCESCHGPGSLHAAKHAGRTFSGSGDEDSTIVHPGRLGREEQESICSQCHLRGGASVMVRGRTIRDYRPGLLLRDFRIDFVPEQASGTMSVVGHVEQMWASACYQRSDSLTCTTCHDPHGVVQPEQQVAYYRSRCNACHDGHCGLAPEVRVQQSADDNCAGCHMPVRPTNLPHFAFTHHRIGIHAAQPPGEEAETAIPTLVPLTDLTAFAPADRQRLLGLAYMEYFGLHPSPAAGAGLRRAQQLLEDAAHGGAATADVEAARARLDWEQGRHRPAIAAAARALERPDLASGAHADALFVLGDSYLQLGDLTAAEDALTRLTRLRRMAGPWSLLGQVRMQRGDFVGAAEAYRKAIEIDPFRADVQQQLSDVYRILGQTEEAARQSELARQLRAVAR